MASLLDWQFDVLVHGESVGKKNMRVAIVHSYYSNRQPSGENVVVDAQAAALRAQGVDVRIIAAQTDTLESNNGYKLRSALTVATGVDPLLSES